MIERVISGGQTGADQAGWRAAKAAGIATGGWMPKGFRTETLSGVGYGEKRPEFVELYGAKEHWSHRYEDRTPLNVRDADVTLWFGVVDSPGCRCTYRAFRDKAGEIGTGDPGVVYIREGWIAVPRPDSWPSPADVAKILMKMPHRIVNIAGNRESRAPGIGAWVERYLTETFRLLKESQ